MNDDKYLADLLSPAWPQMSEAQKNGWRQGFDAAVTKLRDQIDRGMLDLAKKEQKE